MNLKLFIDVVLLLSLWSAAGCDFLMEGVLQMECHDRSLMIALDLSATGTNPRFEAVDGTGAHLITDKYAAKCGYSISILPFLGFVELRASYFSCHTEKKGDKFSFKFNLITNYNGVDAVYALNKSCSQSLPWSPREVTCEVNYMEVSVRSEFPCPSGMNDWKSLRPASSTSNWQVAFQRLDEQLLPMNLSQARRLGYMFDLMYGRLVFRTPYGQHESYRTKVNGVPVEVVHATVFSRKSWVVLMIDLVAACSMHEGSYDNGYMLWSTPEALYSSYNRTQISVGLNGRLLEPAVAEQNGFTLERHNSTVEIGIPYNADGGLRKSFVSGGIFEFYIINLYLRQTLVDERRQETMVRFHRTLVSPLLPCSLVTEDRTVKAEGVFTIYLEVPGDVELTSVQLNGKVLKVPFNDHDYTLAETINLNNTRSYILKVPLRDPVVIQQFSKENAAMIHKLDVNFTLIAVPETAPYYHTISVMVLMDVSPPSFNTACNPSGISFELAHQSYNYLWDISIGPDQLTLALAAKHGYIMSNDSHSLLLHVPLFTHGYEYKDISLKGFLGTFEVLVKSRDTSKKILTSTVKTCLFNSTKLIVCSTNGWVTVVADLSHVLPSSKIPTGTHLSNDLCVAKETDGTRVLYSFPLNSCGSVVKLSKGNVIYQNKIYYYFGMSNSTEGLTLQCTYPLTGLYSLFSTYRFDSEEDGVGKIYPMDAKVLPSTTVPPAKPQTATPQRTRSPTLYLPSFYPTARYIKVYRTHDLLGSYKGSKGNEQSNTL